jgi:transposase InsO family protein
MKTESRVSDNEQWARFRFAVIGPLLSSPPCKGELGHELRCVSAKLYKHPLTGAGVRFGVSTVERWYYAARDANDPLARLRNRVRKDAGSHPSLGEVAQRSIRAQYQAHPGWSYRLHYDNQLALVEDRDCELQQLPSYAVVRRWMKSQGLLKRRRTRVRHTPGAQLAEEHLAHVEVRSYEAEFVGGLFHTDFHSGSLQVLGKDGSWITPHLLAVIDDKSRLCCHGQWYQGETAENFAHGFAQALLKRGLPRALMSDNGGALTAGEIEQGLLNLGILHELTLPYSPYQNAKQEVFWVPTETRLLAMLEGVPNLNLRMLNEATQAWIELEYNRHVHSETGTAPLVSFLSDKNVLRDGPSPETLRRSFRINSTRTQRRSDGTLSIEGVRFEIPNHLRHIQRLAVRYARWDLSCADVVEEPTGTLVATLRPLNKVKNAEGHRRRLDPLPSDCPPPQSQVAPLLKKLLADYAAMGVPPAYIPKEENQ